MIKKSFWLEEKQARFIEKQAKKRKDTESEYMRLIINFHMHDA